MKMMSEFQQEVSRWAVACFGVERAVDPRERNLRFIEESLELVQSNGLSKEEAQAVLDYVYSRTPGELFQEVGGVTITLAALCQSAKVSMDSAATLELSRVHEKILDIRQKNLGKPLGWTPTYKPK